VLLAECNGLRCARPAEHRRRVRATASERTRTPSIGAPQVLRPEWAETRSLFAFAFLPRTLSPAPSRAQPRQRRTGRFRLSPCEHGERCVSPTSATDLRPRAPDTDHPIPERAVPPCGAHRRPLTGPLPQRAPACLRSWTSGKPSGGASLDGDPPASTLVNDRAWRAQGRNPERRAGTARSWWSCDRQHLRAMRPVTAFSAANRARDVASGTLCRDRPPCPASREKTREKDGRARRTARPRVDRRLVKDRGFRRTRAPSVAEISLRSADGRSRGLALPHGETDPSGQHCCRRTRGLATACMRPPSTGLVPVAALEHARACGNA